MHMQPVTHYSKKFLIIILALGCFWVLLEAIHQHSCTIFTVSQGNTVLFGDNFDYHEKDLVIGFYPASASEYGSVHFGYRKGEGSDAQPQYQRLVNDQGLSWAVNSIPRTKVNPHPEKPFSFFEDEYLYRISREAATVQEAIRIARTYDFAGYTKCQIHIADATGDAVVISPDRDGETVFTRKAAGDGYLLSTNFNLAIPEKGPVDFRWDTASSMLKEFHGTQELTPESAMDILQAVFLKTLTTHTLLSNVIDLKNGDIYLSYLGQYDGSIKLNIIEELAKGQRIVEARSLFSTETANSGETSYRFFETRFRLVVTAVILTGTGLVGGGGFFLIRKIQKRSGEKARNVNHIVNLL